MINYKTFKIWLDSGIKFYKKYNNKTTINSSLLKYSMCILKASIIYPISPSKYMYNFLKKYPEYIEYFL